jgi:hypothetical membrane protein
MATSTVFKLTRLALIIAVGLTSIAMLLYPGGTGLDPTTRGYSFFHNSLSDLGSTVAWNGQRNPGAMFQLAASLILVLAGVGCFVGLIRVYASSRVASWLARAAGVVVLLAGAGLVGAALTPQDRYAALHARCSLLAIGSFPLATALLAAATARNGRLRRRVPIAWLALTFVVVAWALVMPTGPTTDRELAIPVTLQKVVVISLSVTLIFQSLEAERVAAAEALVRGAV